MVTENSAAFQKMLPRPRIGALLATDKQQRRAKLLTVIGAAGFVAATVLMVLVFLRSDVFSFLSLVAVVILYFLLLPTVAAIAAMIVSLCGKVKSKDGIITLIVMGVCGCVVAVLAVAVAVFVCVVLATAA